MLTVGSLSLASLVSNPRSLTNFSKSEIISLDLSLALTANNNFVVLFSRSMLVKLFTFVIRRLIFL